LGSIGISTWIKPLHGPSNSPRTVYLLNSEASFGQAQ
jgi:hypothetical protein